MTEEKIRKIIRDVFQEELKKETEKITKISQFKNTFKRIEEMLRCHRRFKRRILELEEELENIVIKKQVSYEPIFLCAYEHLSDIEKIEIKKEEINSKINKYKALVSLTDFGLEEIKQDKHFKIIELRYFEQHTIGKVAETIGIAETTVKENRNRLINKLCEIMYPDEILENF